MQSAYSAQIVKFSSRINVILEEDRFSAKMTSLGKEFSLSLSLGSGLLTCGYLSQCTQLKVQRFAGRLRD